MLTKVTLSPKAAGVDVVEDDSPEAVTISSFDPIRREVAKRAMAKLVVDGRIHPAHIEKLVSDAQKEVEQIVREAGEQAVYEAGVPGLHFYSMNQSAPVLAVLNRRVL